MILQKAQELGNDPAQMFYFVRDQIGYEAYQGALRGARGTLWSKAGNAVDQASLLMALLRASGIPARYVQGTLPDALAQQLLGTMFSEPHRVAGCLLPGVALSAPVHDAGLVAETRQHYWVQFGNQWHDADPTFPGAQLGQRFAPPGSTFTELPARLRHQVTVRLQRELLLPHMALVGVAVPEVATVLEETFDTVELVGKTVSLGHFVNSASLQAAGSAVTHTYAPYLVVNPGDGTLPAAGLRRGRDYQEILTDVPARSQILSGLFLEVVILFPEVDGKRPTEVVKKTLFDRLGAVARHQGAQAVSQVAVSAPPAISNLDVLTLAVISARQAGQGTVQREIAVRIAKDLEVLFGHGTALTALQTDTAMALLEQLVLETTSALAGHIAVAAAALTDVWADGLRTPWYVDTPQLIAVRHGFAVEPATQAASSGFAVDILRTGLRSYATTGQAELAAPVLRFLKGVSDKLVEQELLPRPPSAYATTAVASFDVLRQALTAPGAYARQLTYDHLGELAALPLPEEASVRLTSSLQAGRMAVVPGRPVWIDGQARLAWLEVDPQTGDATIALDDGTHAAMVGQFGAYGSSRVTVPSLVQFVAQHGRQAVEMTREVLERLAIVQDVHAQRRLLVELIGALHQRGGVDPFVERLLEAAADVLAWQEGRRVSTGTLLYRPEQPSPALPSGSAGVAVAITEDTRLVVPHAGGKVPSVLQVGVKNLAAVATTFALEVSNVPARFTAAQSLPQLTLPAGGTGEISVCLVPTGDVPEPGTAVAFDVTVRSTADPMLAVTERATFVMPAFTGVTLAVEPPLVTTAPGVPVPITLSVYAVGNMGAEVTWSVDLPAELSAHGGLPPMTLGVGASARQTWTLTPSAGTLPNSTLSVTIRAHFGTAEPQTLVIPVRVLAPGTRAIADAAGTAEQLGHTALADRLHDLSLALTHLLQEPQHGVWKSQALAALDSTLSQLANDAYLSWFVADLTVATDALATASTVRAVQAAVQHMGHVLETFTYTAGSLVQHAFTAVLLSNALVAEPQTPATFALQLHNRGTDTTTYTLALGALPPDVIGELGQTSVTLERDAVAVISVTLTTTVLASPLAVPFDILVSVEAAPAIRRTVPGVLLVPPASRQALLALEPSAWLVEPGEAAPFSLRVQNPTDTSVTYTLAVQGVPPGWVDLVATVDVPAWGEVAVPLILTSDLFAPAWEYGLVVTASTHTGAVDFVPARLLLDGAPTVPPVSLQAHGVVVDLTPTDASAGQGSSAVFTVRVTNTGSTPDTIVVAHNLPTEVTGVFAETSLLVLPGASNFRDVPLTLTLQPGMAPGVVPFRVVAASLRDPTRSDADDGTLVVADAGVQVTMTPTSVAPGEAVQMLVRNTGQISDTFDLALAGPLGLLASLSTHAVTLQAGEAQTVQITVPALPFALPGSLPLVGLATAQSNTAVRDSAAALVVVGPTQGMTAAFDPPTITLPLPGAATFLLLVQNTGNTEDAYRVEVVGKTGDVTAALIGRDGQPTQTLESLHLPGLSMASIVLQATLNDLGQGVVSVQVTAQSNPALAAVAVATVQTLLGPPNHAPVVNAGADQETMVGRVVRLSATFTDADVTDRHTATVTWGDATLPSPGFITEGNGAGTVTAAHTYGVAGTFPVTVCVKDDQNATGCGTYTVTVAPAVLDHFLGYQPKLLRRQKMYCAEGSPRRQGRLCTREEDCGGNNGATAPTAETHFCVSKPVQERVLLVDQFTASYFDIVKPRFLYNPTDTNSAGITDAETHLQGYGLQPTEPDAYVSIQHNVWVRNQLHDLVLTTSTLKRLLVPTALRPLTPINPPDPAVHSVDHFTCYQVKVIAGERDIQAGFRVNVVDRFRQPSRYIVRRPKQLCRPAKFAEEDIKNRHAALLCYHIEPAMNGLVYPPVRNLYINNRFGPLLVDAMQVNEFCLSSQAIDLGVTPDVD